MAVLSLYDWAKRIDPDGSPARIVEIMNEINEVTDDVLWSEGNLPTGNRVTIRTGIPSGTWRRMYGGVVPAKSTTKQVDDTCGMLEAYSEVDKALADLNGNTAEFRLSEAKSFIEGLTQDFCETLFYGDVSQDPEQFMGLSPRFNSLSSADSSDNVIDGGGTGNDNTSVWLVVWGENTAYGIFPKGSTAGLTHTDKGQVTLGDSTNGYYEGYRDHFKWDCGLTVKDWRYIVRICNIDVSSLTKDASTGSADLVDLMVQALELPPSLSAGRASFYCNRTVRSFLRRQIINRDNVYLGFDTVSGKKVLTFGEIPVRRCDQILNTESAVS